MVAHAGGADSSRYNFVFCRDDSSSSDSSTSAVSVAGDDHEGDEGDDREGGLRRCDGDAVAIPLRTEREGVDTTAVVAAIYCALID